ncbi:MAG: diguanylate cyclase [bacterium]|nr:diguanylate cyclase [bacterium]
MSADQGLTAPSADTSVRRPVSAIIDSESRAFRVIVNANQHHGHGGCQPLAAIAGQDVGAVVVGGIGAGALSRLQAAGVRVWRTDQGTIAGALEAFIGGTLTEMTAAAACAGHGHGSPGQDGSPGHGHQCHGGHS